ncbi:unnamed protein product [Caenorhabditis nigoni]
MGTVADALTDAGHNVTVLMPIIERQFLNDTCLKRTKNVIFVEQNEQLRQQMQQRSKRFVGVWTSTNSNPYNLVKKSGDLATIFSDHCRNVMSKKNLIEQMKSENFDLAITEPFDTCAYAFFEAINIRAHVAVYSCSRLDHVSEVIGQPVPSNNEYAAAKQFYPNIRSWREVLPGATFIFTNQIPVLDFPSPTFDKMIPIGGLSVQTDKKDLVLEEKWSKILGLRKKNVLISFGSNARSDEMPMEYKQSLLEVFQSMPDITFIWKYENPEDTFTKHLDNVYLSSWLPQNELLTDPRLTLFITHGGLASVFELAMLGKPAIMIPVAADQTRNAEILKRHGVAVVLSKTDLANSDQLRSVIENVIGDSSYQQNANRLAEILRNQPTNPKETLVKYVEFAARFGKLPSLDNYGRHQSFVQYFLLDVVAIIALIAIVSSYISYRIFKCAVRRSFGSRCSEAKNKKE